MSFIDLLKIKSKAFSSTTSLLIYLYYYGGVLKGIKWFLYIWWDKMLVSITFLYIAGFGLLIY